MPDETATSGPHILVVDDSETDRTLVMGLMSSSHPDWQIESCATAAEGLQILDDHEISAVVTDLFMPEMSGEEFLVETRQRFPSVPVILVTSQGSDEIAARSLELGAVNYVPKRKLSDDLVVAVDEILRSKHESRLAKHVLSCLTFSRTVFQIDYCVEQVRCLLHLIRERLQTQQGLDDMEVRQVTDAVREALMNAFIHGNRVAGTLAAPETDNASESNDESFIIELELKHEDDSLSFTVTDQGEGFDPGSDSVNCGRGIRIMRQHMDSVEFGLNGRQVLLKKQLRQETIG